MTTRKPRRPLEVIIHQVGTPSERAAALAEIDRLADVAWKQFMELRAEQATAGTTRAAAMPSRDEPPEPVAGGTTRPQPACQQERSTA